MQVDLRDAEQQLRAQPAILLKSSSYEERPLKKHLLRLKRALKGLIRFETELFGGFRARRWLKSCLRCGVVSSALLPCSMGLKSTRRA